MAQDRSSEADARRRIGELIEIARNAPRGAAKLDEAQFAELDRLHPRLTNRESWESGSGAALLAQWLKSKPGAVDRRLQYLRVARRSFLSFGQGYGDVAGRQALEEYELLFSRGEYAEADKVLRGVLESLSGDGTCRPAVLTSLASLSPFVGSEDVGALLRDALDCTGINAKTKIQAMLGQSAWFLRQGLPDLAATVAQRVARELDELERGGGSAPWSRTCLECSRAELALVAQFHGRARSLSEQFLARADARAGLNAVAARRMEVIRALSLAFDPDSRDLEAAREILARLYASSAHHGQRLEMASQLAAVAELAGDEEGVSHWLQTLANGRVAARPGSPAAAGLPVLRLPLSVRQRAATLRCRQLLRVSPLNRAELAEVGQSLSVTLVEMVKQWHAEPPPMTGRGLLEFRTPMDALHALCSAELALHGEKVGSERALAHVFRAQTASTLLGRLGGPCGDLASFRREVLGDGWRPDGLRRGAVILLPGSQSSLLFALDDRRVVARETVGRSELAQLGRAMLQRVVERSSRGRGAARNAAIERLGGQLREALVTPVASLLNGWRGFYWIGGEHVGGLGLELLADESGRPLGVTKAANSLYSMPFANALLARHNESEVPTAGMFLLASPDHAPTERYEPLRLDDGAIAALAGRVIDVDAVSRGDASRAAFEGMGERPYSVGSILSHGIYDGDREQPAGFLLSAGFAAPPVAIFAEDVRSVVCPPFVFLGVCGAARGPVRRGDAGASDLPGAFFESGAVAVVGAATAVPAAQTGALMAAFHDEVFAGVAPDEAVRRARQKLFDAGEKDLRATCLMGLRGLGSVRLPPEGLAPEPRRDWLWLGWFAGALVLAAAAGMAVRLRRRE
ncbi:MAG: CHAT domain-containing protein [Planctomycetota bacterium]